MNWFAQLTHLILSYYREDPQPLQQLSVLRTCKLSRRWGVLRINCPNSVIAHHLIEAIDLLQAPIVQLRLAHHIKIIVRGDTVKVLPLNLHRVKIK